MNGIIGIIGIKLVNIHCRTGSAQVVLLKSPRQDQDIYFKTPRCYSESGQWHLVLVRVADSEEISH